MTATVSATRATDGALRLSDQPDLPVTVLLRTEGPLVRIVLVVEEEPVDLPVDRALLTQGVVEGAGDGDVQVQTVGDQVLVGFGDLVVVLPRLDVTELLLASYADAPTGAEHDLVIALERTALRSVL